MKKVVISAVQMKMSENIDENIEKAAKYVEEAAKSGANVILLPELFESLYFCQEKNYDFYELAHTPEEDKGIAVMKKLAKELNVVIPVSFYEKCGNTYFNSVAMIDAGSEMLGIYRKTHIPDDHFYQEKFYFTPGNTGFRVWDTLYAKIGVGICWDQWFPETARCMTLMGADILFYPTAIGSEPILEVDSKPHWQRCMQGHSAANIIPVVAANRVGTETVKPSEENNHQKSSLNFYGSTFMTDETGEVIKEMDRVSEGILTNEYDLEAAKKMRTEWGVFRDRCPQHYKKILELR